jgi:hypothetical protein
MALGNVGNTVANIGFIELVVASVVSFIFGWIWYGPLFGKLWLKGSGMSEKEAKKMHKQGMMGKMALNFLGTLVLVYVFANLIGWIGISNVVDLAWLSVWLGVGFFGATTLLGDVVWKGRPWSYYFINLFYWTLNLEIIGFILVSFG